MKPSEAFTIYCQAFIARDAAAIADLFTKEGDFYIPLAGERIKGKKNIEAEMHRSAVGQRDIEVEVRRAIDQGNIGYVEASYRAIVVGTGGKLDGSPHRLDFRLLARIVMRGDKIERLEEFLDTRPLFPEERQK